MKTVQLIDAIDDKYPHDFEDFFTITDKISNGCFIPYDTNEEVEYEPESDEAQAHDRIRAWIRTASGEESVGEVLIYVSW